MLDKEYKSKEVEARIRKYWEDNKIFSFYLESKKSIFSIDTPPPTVSGKMHIGHAFSYAHMDFIARYKRMKGFNVFYPFGTDDNGLPTERLVEKLNNVKSKDMPRYKFVDLCLKTLKKITPDFIDDWKKIAVSCDYNLYYSTIDKNSQKISQQSFIELFKNGLIYRKEFPALWCTKCQTEIAQAELEDKEEKTLFSTVKFKIDNEDLLIGTTRPEFLAACVAVFINPNDGKNKHFIGKKAKVPLFDFEVPIIADESAQIGKGTNVLMICSFADKYDVEAINRHKLTPKLIINKDGALQIKKYKGLNVREAREKILDDLKKENLIKEQKEIVHTVNTHDKCGTEIEFLPTDQWFIKILDKKEKFVELGERVKWHPEFMFKRYENWIEGLQWDWSISRDRHFGVPIPIWECKKCNEFILPEENELPIDPLQIKKKCEICKKKAEPVTKVLDTWATSSLTPQIASSLVGNKIQIPYSQRSQSHDILRTWGFYTIVRSYYNENKIPWENIVISGFVLLKGEKMSKSKGNVIEPQPLIERYSADALRYWAASSKYGDDVDFHEKDVVTGQKTLIKLWNTFRFFMMHMENYNFDDEELEHLELIDKWLLIKLNRLIKECTENFDKYEYYKVKADVDNFFWNVFCDYYLEIIKDRLYNESKRGINAKRSAQYTLYNSFFKILRIFAPIMPYITEEIYSEYFRDKEDFKSVHLSKWPEYDKKLDNGIENKGNEFIDIVKKVRLEKAKNKKSIKEEIVLNLEKKYEDYFDINTLYDLRAVTNAVEINFGDEFSVEF